MSKLPSRSGLAISKMPGSVVPGPRGSLTVCRRWRGHVWLTRSAMVMQQGSGWPALRLLVRAVGGRTRGDGARSRQLWRDTIEGDS